jgi:hypothetical protein
MGACTDRVIKDDDYVVDSELIEKNLDRIRGLAHCDVIRERLVQRRRQRMQQDHDYYQSSCSSHLREHGHELRFGCCRVGTSHIPGDAA